MYEDIVFVGDESADMNKLLSVLINDQRVSSISMSAFDLEKDSMRVWLRQFECLASLLGINNMDTCISKLSVLMPYPIRSFIYRLGSAPEKQTWKSVTTALLHQFAMPEEREHDLLESKLLSCRQGPKESVRDYNIRWLNHTVYLSTSCLQEPRFKWMYIKGLRYDFMRISLAVEIERCPQLTLFDITAKANSLEWDHIILKEELLLDKDDQESEAGCISQNTLVHENTRAEHNKANHDTIVPDTHTQTNHVDGVQTEEEEPPRLYDKRHRPICGYCQGKHRNIQCKQRPKPSSLDVSQMHRADIMSPRIEFFSDFEINKQKVRALWGIAYSKSVVCYQTVKKLKLKIKSSNISTLLSPLHRPVECKGTTQLDVYGENIEFLVLDGMMYDIVLGYDLLQAWEATINSQTNTITIKAKNAIHSIKFETARSDVDSSPS